MTTESRTNPWKLPAIGMALVIATVLVTGLVVANLGGSDGDKKPAPVTALRAAPRVASIAMCNQSAAAQAGQREKTKDTVIADGGSGAGKGAVIGGIVGAGDGTLYGLNENRKHDERYRNAYVACMHTRGYPV